MMGRLKRRAIRFRQAPFRLRLRCVPRRRRAIRCGNRRRRASGSAEICTRPSKPSSCAISAMRVLQVPPPRSGARAPRCAARRSPDAWHRASAASISACGQSCKRRARELLRRDERKLGGFGAHDFDLGMSALRARRAAPPLTSLCADGDGFRRAHLARLACLRRERAARIASISSCV